MEAPSAQHPAVIFGKSPGMDGFEVTRRVRAQRCSTPGSRVWVTLARQSRSCLLSVASPGQPLSPEERKAIFKRFYRADQARVRNGSYGLGLSIAEAIVTAHRGRIWAEAGDGCNIFRVQFPANPA